MTDICMCGATRCPHRMICYRYRKIPKKYQEYADFFNNTLAKCPMFAEILPIDKLNEER